MKKTKLSLVVAGLLAIYMISAVPTFAEEPVAQEHKSFFSWISMLSPEQRQMFDDIVAEHIARYEEAQRDPALEPYDLMKGILDDIPLILDKEQLKVLQEMSREKPELSLISVNPEICVDCAYTWTDTYNAKVDLESAIPLFNEDNCDVPPFHLGCGHQVYCFMEIALDYTTWALANLSNSIYMCNCSKITAAKDDLDEAEKFLQYAIDGTSSYNCSPSPWLTYLNQAMVHLQNALNHADDCIADVCD